MKVELLISINSFWVGVHWMPTMRQWSVNVVPCVTLRIKLDPLPVVKAPGGYNYGGSGRKGNITEVGTYCGFNVAYGTIERVRFVYKDTGKPATVVAGVESMLELRGEDVYLNGEQVINIRAVLTA